MQLPDPGVVPETHSMQTLAVLRPRPGVFRMTSLLSSECYLPGWDERAIAAHLRFPGVSRRDFEVRRFDAERGIVDIDFMPTGDNSIMRLWLDSVEVGTRTRIGGPGVDTLPNFASGRRVLMFADQHSVPAVAAILENWPQFARGILWIDTPNPVDICELPVVDGVGVVSFHVDMGFDPLVTAARRIELDSTTTVWAAGERSRMDAIQATCEAAGLSEDDTRVFGYWSAGHRLRHRA